MTNEQCMYVIENTHLTTAQWTALRWHFENNKKENNE